MALGNMSIPLPRVEQIKVKIPPLIEPALNASWKNPIMPVYTTGFSPGLGD